MSSRSKYRKLPDLFVQGAELVFEDGTVMWLQVMNPFEVDEARKDAQTARARFSLAMKEIGTPEYDQVRASFSDRGSDEIVDELVEGKQSEIFVKASNDIETDPEWKDKLDIIQRSDDILALPEDDPEHMLLAQVNAEWVAEVQRRIKDDSEYERESLDKLGFDQLLEEYMKEWVDRRGSARALVAYNVTETFYACRACDAAPDEEGLFTKESHAGCNGHRERVFEQKDDIRSLPEELLVKIRESLDNLQMSIREAKN